MTSRINAIAVVHFAGTNRTQDAISAVETVWRRTPRVITPQETALGDVRLAIIPGGFSHGDYLRCGAIAARQPVMHAITNIARQGALVLGICNGFQVLCEAGLLPGTLTLNAQQRFVHDLSSIDVTHTESPFTCAISLDRPLRLPIANHGGRYVVDPEALPGLISRRQILWRYSHTDTTKNGSVHNIAGLTNPDGNIAGLMPHPENAIDPHNNRLGIPGSAWGTSDGLGLFRSLATWLS